MKFRAIPRQFHRRHRQKIRQLTFYAHNGSAVSSKYFLLFDMRAQGQIARRRRLLLTYAGTSGRAAEEAAAARVKNLKTGPRLLLTRVPNLNVNLSTL